MSKLGSFLAFLLVAQNTCAANQPNHLFIQKCGTYQLTGLLQCTLTNCEIIIAPGADSETRFKLKSRFIAHSPYLNQWIQLTGTFERADLSELNLDDRKPILRSLPDFSRQAIRLVQGAKCSP